MIDNIPPKQTLSGRSDAAPEMPPGYDHLPHADHAAGGLPPHGLVLHDPSVHGDANAFPVLKAFQDYLEMERQQARKRLVTLTIFFVTLMTLVVAGFIVAFIFMLGNVSKREDRQQSRQDQLLAEILQQRKAPEASAVLPPDHLAQQMAKEFQSAAQNLQTNLGTQLSAMGNVATKLDSKVEAQNAEMARLRDALAALQKDNANIRADLPKLAIEAARKTAPPAVASVTPPAVPAARLPSTASPATTTAGTPAAATGKGPKGYDETVLQIRSRDSENNIPWRTFVPR